MRITADTNILVRVAVCDDEKQARATTALLREAETVAVSVTCLCEFVWVLRRLYRFDQSDISAALDALLIAGNVAVNRPAVDAGLAVPRAGGDFADGLIAYEASWLGGETYVAFDQKAVSLIARQGQQAHLLA